MLEAHDNILNVRKEEERQSMSDVDDRSDTLPKEAVTRVRLVQFEKTTNEPMVCVQKYSMFLIALEIRYVEVVCLLSCPILHVLLPKKVTFSERQTLSI